MLGADARRSRLFWAASSVLLIAGVVATMLLAGKAQEHAEGRTTAAAQVVAKDNLAPLIADADIARPVSGDAYRALASSIEENVVAHRPVTAVKLWLPDGTVVFASERELVGTRLPGMRDRLGAVVDNGTTSVVVEGEFQTLVPLRPDSGRPAEVVAELSQPYDPIWTSANWPWRLAAIVLGIACFATLAMLFLSFRPARPPEPATSSAFRPDPDRKPKAQQPHGRQSGIKGTTPDQVEAPGYVAAEEPALAGREIASAGGHAGEQTAKRLRAAEDHLRKSAAERDALLEQLEQARYQLAELQTRAGADIEQVRRSTEEEAALATERLAEAQAGLEDLAARLRAAEQKTESAERRVSVTETRLQEKQARAEETELEAAHLREVLTKTEGHAAEVEARIAEFEARAAQADDAQGEIAHLRERLLESEAKVAQAAKETADANQRVVELERRDESGELLEAREQAHQAESQLEMLRRRYEETLSRAQRLEADIAARATRRRQPEEDEEDLEELLKVAQGRLAASSKRLQEVEEQAFELDRELKLIRARDEEQRRQIEAQGGESRVEEALNSADADPLVLENRRASGPFMAALSRDAKNSISAVLGTVLALQHRDATEEQESMLRRLATHTRKLDHIVADVLDADRVARGAVELKRRRTDIDALVRRVVEESGITQDRIVSIDSRSLVVSVAPIRVEQMVGALLNQTISRTRPRSNVWVKIRPHEGGALIAVEDEEIASDAAMSPIVSVFASMHGGTACVQSRPGRGSSFQVYLPEPDAAQKAGDNESEATGNVVVAEAPADLGLPAAAPQG